MVVFPEVIVLARKSSILIVNGSNMLLYFDDEFSLICIKDETFCMHCALRAF